MIAIVAPLLVYIYPPAAGNRKQDLKVTLQKGLGELKNGEGLKFDAPRNSAFVMKDGGGDNAAGDPAFGGFVVKDEQGRVNVFAVNCSHLGCSIALQPGDSFFQCPCHGSQFYLDGSVKHGPAVAPLSHLNWKPGSAPNELIIEGMELQGLG